ncbi:MAG TPA: hypothetical protein VGV89_03280 [Thermoplasmata archaeon]|nr:hypothetical protein [Thermoplasmata archaeon]
MPSEDIRRPFIKQRLRRGTSAREIRETFNFLVKLSAEEIERRWARGWGDLSGQEPTTSSEVHRVQSALGRKARTERREARREMRLKTEATKEEFRLLGLFEPSYDAQKAHDAGVMYRATREEKFREVFVEGS